ncbi:MAG: hypothetical protein ACTSO7_13725 [Candidatus Heimdallarchaeota archaeon]
MDFDYLEIYGDDTSSYPRFDGVANEYNIKQALTDMVDDADGNDVIVFTTSGHGHNISTPGVSYFDAWDSGDGENGQDGRLYDYELAGILDDAVAARIFVFLDMCRAGGFGPDLMNMGNSARVYCVAACSATGDAQEYSTKLNGYWTFYFLANAWIYYYSGCEDTPMEDVFDYADSQYPFSGAADCEEYDGDSSKSFKMA